MEEGPSFESSGTRATPTRVHPTGPEDNVLCHDPGVPRVVVKADLLPAVSVLSLVAMLGFPLAWLWSHLALPEQSTLTSSGDLVPLLLVESYHEFDGLGLFLLLEFALGTLTGAAMWMLRGRRGPVILLAGVLGSLVAAWLGMRMGTSFAAGLYAMPSAPKVGDLITVAPELTEQWSILAQPLAVALVYGLIAAWNGLDDLGRRLR